MDATRKLYEVTFDNVAAELLAQGSHARTALNRALDIATVGLVARNDRRHAAAARYHGRVRQDAQAVRPRHRPVSGRPTSVRRHAGLHREFALGGLLRGVRYPGRHPGSALAVSVAKAYASDAYREVGNRAIQVHGGMGFTWENDVHLFYRRAKASELAFGDATFHRETNREVGGGHRRHGRSKAFWPRMHANERGSYPCLFVFIPGLSFSACGLLTPRGFHRFLDS